MYNGGLPKNSSGTRVPGYPHIHTMDMHTLTWVLRYLGTKRTHVVLTQTVFQPLPITFSKTLQLLRTSRISTVAEPYPATGCIAWGGRKYLMEGMKHRRAHTDRITTIVWAARTRLQCTCTNVWHMSLLRERVAPRDWGWRWSDTCWRRRSGVLWQRQLGMCSQTCHTQFHRT